MNYKNICWFIIIFNSFYGQLIYCQDQTITIRDSTISDVILTIDDFKIFSKQQSLHSIAKATSKIFSLYFLTHDGFQLIEKSEIIESAATKLKIGISDYNFNNSRPLDYNKEPILKVILDSLKIQKIISGSVQEYVGRYTVRLEVHDISTSENEYFRASTNYNDSLIFLINNLANEIGDIINPIEKIIRNNRIAVLPFDVYSINPSIGEEEKSRISNYYREVIFYYSNLRKSFNILSLETTEISTQADYFDICSMLNADILITGSIKIEDNSDTIKVAPVFYFKDYAMVINSDTTTIPDYEAESIESFIKSIDYGINSLIDKSGKWILPNIENLKTHSDSINAIIKYYNDDEHLASLRIIDFFPSSGSKLNDTVILYRIKNLLQLNEFKLAKKEIIKQLQVNPNDLTMLFELGKIEMIDGNLDSAFLYLNNVYSKDKLTTNILYYIGKLYYYYDSLDSAEFYLEKDIELYQNPDSYHLLGVILYNENELNEAQKNFFKAKNHYSDSINKEKVDWSLRNLYFDIGVQFLEESYNNSSKLIFAKKAFNKAVKLYPDESSLDMLRYTYLLLGYLDSCRIEIEKGLELNIFDYSIYMKHANELRNYKENRGYVDRYLIESINYYNDYAEVFQFDPLPYRYAGSAYFRMEKYRKAEKKYIETLKRNDRDITNYLNMAEIQLIREKYKNAIDTLNRIDSLGLEFDGKGQERVFEYLKLIGGCLLDIEQCDKQDFEKFKTEYKNDPVYYTWSFSTLNNWIIKNPPKKLSGRNKIIESILSLNEFMEENVK